MQLISIYLFIRWVSHATGQIARLRGRMIASLELYTHWVMVDFVPNHYTAKAFFVLEFSVWGLVDQIHQTPGCRGIFC